MLKQLLCYCQYILPQHLLSALVGKLANSRSIWLKNTFIKNFCRAYPINMSEAEQPDPLAYPTFNAFFIRKLKTGARTIDSSAKGITSPADGSIAALGNIQQGQLLQAKDMYFDLNTLVGGDAEATAAFMNGSFATIYLAPHNYHRVHMPVSGSLRKSIYIPGKLFSVNRMTSELIPNLYGRNERLVMLFDTDHGPMAVIMVGALIVGSMQTVWMQQPIKHAAIETLHPTSPINLEKGAELGHFQLGSTAILLFPQDSLDWQPLASGSSINMGQVLGTLRQA